MSRIYELSKKLAGSLGLLPLARWLRDATDMDLRRRKRMHRQRYLKFKENYGEVLGHKLYDPANANKTALVCSIHFPEVQVELALIKALELAGFVPVVLTSNTDWMLPNYYELAGIPRIYHWNEFIEPADIEAAQAMVEKYESVHELLKFESGDTRIGRHAISTAIRKHRSGTFDLMVSEDRQILATEIASGIAFAKASKKILDKFQPDILVCTDKGYSPKGELFDSCLARNIDAVSWDFGHKSNSVILKRFNTENRDQHNNTLSEDLWRRVREIEWTEADFKRLHMERYDCYASGEWYSIAGTQVNKRFMEVDEIRQQLGLDPTRRTAVIFPHILWDATLFWGKSLYPDYEEWLVETVRAACKNDQVNWVIKIHPAHVGKGLREGFKGEPAEAVALREHIGELPPHVYMIPADSEMSTYSLFDAMDYCITVRGSVGIEASVMGIPVLTAGQGPYDHKGFTIDSDSREEYLSRISRIHEIPRLSSAEQELAQRFAYGYFIMRVLPLTSVGIKYHASQARHLAEGQVNIRSEEGWRNAEDIKPLAKWFSNTDELEFWHNPVES